MLREALLGTAAGAVGTVALNATTYGDMVVRGRPPSSVPSEIAGQLAGKLGIDLSAENEEQGGPTAQNRKSGLGRCRGSRWGLGSAPFTAPCGRALGMSPGCAPGRCCVSPQWSAATARPRL